MISEPFPTAADRRPPIAVIKAREHMPKENSEAGQAMQRTVTTGAARKSTTKPERSLGYQCSNLVPESAAVEVSVEYVAGRESAFHCGTVRWAAAEENPAWRCEGSNKQTQRRWWSQSTQAVFCGNVGPVLWTASPWKISAGPTGCGPRGKPCGPGPPRPSI